MPAFGDDREPFPANTTAAIRDRAFLAVSPERLGHVNLYLDQRVLRAGEQLGPAFQDLRAPRPSVLVFADDEPRANFGHPCRYLLFDPESGELHAELPARFPPWGARIPDSLDAFHQPVRPVPTESLYHVKPELLCPVLFPAGRRYAIFYSGMSNTRHLNDMEFGYRTLVHRYGFARRDITVLSFNGTTDTQEGVNTIWPGDGTPYQIAVSGPGDRAAFEAAVDALKPRLREDDLLFIHTNNHGDNYGSGSFLCAYPDWGQYLADDFAAKLGELPRYQSLVVLVEQCNAGGFNEPVIKHSTARATSVAAAAVATQSSYASPDGHWDSFARDWFAAQAGHDPYGAALAFNPDANADGKIEAAEAFGYASTIRNPSDSPQFDESSPAGGQVWLGRTYVVWWWWCWILREVLARPYRELPEAEYYARLHKIQPELSKQAASLDDQSAVLRQETAALVGELVAGAFGRAAAGSGDRAPR
jgi:hypothetical protein